MRGELAAAERLAFGGAVRLGKPARCFNCLLPAVFGLEFEPNIRRLPGWMRWDG